MSSVVCLSPALFLRKFAPFSKIKMDYVRLLAEHNDKSLHDGDLRFHKLSCFQHRAVCRIVAFEKLDNSVTIFYGIDSEGVICFGPHTEWESLFYNYDLLLEFARADRSIEYNKSSVKRRLREFFAKEPDAVCGVIGL